jgi:hypothetical protein
LLAQAPAIFHHFAACAKDNEVARVNNFAHEAYARTVPKQEPRIGLMTVWLLGASAAGLPKDIKEFVKQAFKEQIETIKGGIYCRALSCEFEVETFYATETDPKTYTISTTGWLEGTIPGLKGSARREMGLTASYTRGTCIVRDLKPIFDTVTNNNGWGASRIEAAFRRIAIPTTVVLTPEDCAKVDAFIFQAS